MCECEGQTSCQVVQLRIAIVSCFVSGLISCWFVQCCTNVETITLTSILNLRMVSYIVYTVSVLPLVLFHACVMMSVLSNTCSVYCTCCNDEAVTGSVHGNDCHSVSQEYDTSTVVSVRAHEFA